MTTVALNTATKSTAATESKPTFIGSERSINLNKMAALSISHGYSFEKTMAMCKAFNTNRCHPKLDDNEVEQAVRTASRAVQATSKAVQAASKPVSDNTEATEPDLDKVIEEMNVQYAWLTGPMAILRLSDGAILNKTALKTYYTNTRVAMEIDGKLKQVTYYDAWMRSPDRREHIDLGFFAGQAEIVKNHVNLWKKWGATPAAGDVTPWVEMMDFIFKAGSPERQWAEQWFAYPLQNPGAKLNTAMVIWSTRQGVGKSLLAETVGKLYGDHFKTISELDLRSQYNSWAMDSLLVLGEENGGNDRRSHADKLKQMITGDRLFIQEKYIAAAERENHMNFIFTSNHSDALYMEASDRRFFVWSIDSDPLAPAFYENFVKWRDSKVGQSALMHHLQHVDLAGFDPYGHAPITSAKLEMIEHGKSGLERWLSDALTDEYIDGVIGREVVTMKELVGLFHRDTSEKRTSESAMGNALRSQIPYAKLRISAGASGRVSLCSLRNHEKWKLDDHTAWAKEYKKRPLIAL